MAHNDNEALDVVLVGAGIMSTTLAVLLKELDPGLKLEIVEQMASGAVESSNPWNNAGTGHAGLCELNYTPQAADGSADIKKAVQINSQFEVSKQFWSYLVGKGALPEPRRFISPVPHMSFVRGAKDVAFLKKRQELLSAHHAFETMEYTEDRAHVSYNQKVKSVERDGEGWCVTVKDTQDGSQRALKTRFVFLGAGGGALPLLQMSGIPESKGFGGFPVSGQWLRCDNPEVV